MYHFGISTDEHVPLKFHMTERLSKLTKSTEFLMELYILEFLEENNIELYIYIAFHC